MRALIAVPTSVPLEQGRIDRYIAALRRADGVEAIMVPAELDEADARSLVERFDGVMLLGGDDVDPTAYGAEPNDAVYGVNPQRDAFELALTHAAISHCVPVLAICRGHQVLNVALGGTLDQHITGRDGLIGHGVPAQDAGAALHDVVVDPGTRLAGALGATSVTCSSHHHQAVDRVGDGLAVVARAEDGIIEGIELADRAGPWVVGVQWHPEETAADDPVQQRLFETFVDQAASRRG